MVMTVLCVNCFWNLEKVSFKYANILYVSSAALSIIQPVLDPIVFLERSSGPVKHLLVVLLNLDFSSPCLSVAQFVGHGLSSYYVKMDLSRDGA